MAKAIHQLSTITFIVYIEKQKYVQRYLSTGYMWGSMYFESRSIGRWGIKDNNSSTYWLFINLKLLFIILHLKDTYINIYIKKLAPKLATYI